MGVRGRGVVGSGPDRGRRNTVYTLAGPEEFNLELLLDTKEKSYHRSTRREDN